MRTLLLTSVAVLGLSAGSAFAQSSNAQNPPSPTASVAAPDAAPMPHAGRHMRHPMRRHGNAADAAPGDMAAPPTEAYRGGAGSPLSTRATDLTPAPGERIGARLPNPDASGNDPHDLLRAAQRSLNRGQTGAAQQALEMAETRVLSRTTEPSMAGQPDTASMVQNIAQARRALGSRDTAGAKQAIAAALQDRVPPPGPAVTTIPGTPAPMGVPPGQAY